MNPNVNRVWRHQPEPTLGFMNTLGETITAVETRHPNQFPNLRGAQTLLLGTDFSGSHKTARFHVTTFLITNLENLTEWERRRSLLRATTPLGIRRMSYKTLNDAIRQNALVPFLLAADQIPGLLFTLAVDRRVQSLFVKQRKMPRVLYESSELKNWKPDTAERGLQAIHMASLLVRGMSTSGQDILWILDEDDIVANETRHTQFVNVFALISGQYLNHSMGHLRIATTKSDTGRRDLEDLVSICDLTSGTLQELFLSYREQSIPMDAETLVPRVDLKAAKANKILDWLSSDQSLLKRVSIIVEEAPTSGSLRLTSFRVIGSKSI